MPKKVDPLSSWSALNVELMKLTDDREVEKLLRRECAGLKRTHYVFRLYSRFSALRRDREHKELLTALA